MKSNKLGFVVKDDLLDFIEYNIVYQFAQNQNIEIIFIELASNFDQQTFARRWWQSTLKSLVFLQLKIELLTINRPNNKQLKLSNWQSLLKHPNVKQCKVACFHSKEKKERRLSMHGIDEIEKLDIDFLFNLSTCDLPIKDFQNLSRFGFIDVSFAYSTGNLQIPPGFWEILYKNPNCKFIIRLFSNQHENGLVMLAGEIPTRAFYSTNMLGLYNEILSNLSLILDRAKRHFAYTTSFNSKMPGIIENKVTFNKLILYNVHAIKTLLSDIWNNNIFKVSWSVAYHEGGYDQSTFGRGIIVTNPKNRYFADPFVVRYKDRNVIYVEDFNLRSEIACISAIELIGTDYKILGPVLKEDFHLSYPFVFEYKKELYMVPETRQSNTIRLYKCVEFPMKWEFQRILISEIRANDTIIFRHNSLWWLFTTNVNKLLCYYADSPLSNSWTEHNNNPVLFSNKGRNGGYIPPEGEVHFRVSQNNGFRKYGESLNISEIIELDRHSYAEKDIQKVEANFCDDCLSTHHLSTNGVYTAYDFAKLKFSLF